MDRILLLDSRYKEKFIKLADQEKPKKEAFFGMSEPYVNYFIEISGKTAVVSIDGTITHKDRWYSGCSCEEILPALKKLSEMPEVTRIILHIDSPGGEVGGVQTLSDFIYSLRGKKEVIAVADTLAASAAYWIASACEKIYVTEDSAEVGSIGVILTHVSYAGMYENAGIKVTHIQAGDKKSVGTPYRNLSEDDLKEIQAEIDSVYEIFVSAVSKHRGISVEEVKETEARCFMGDETMAKKLADGKISLSDLLAMDDDENIEETEDETEAEEEDDDVEAEEDDTEVEDEEEEDETEAEDPEDEKEAAAVKRGRQMEHRRQKGIRAATLPGMESFMEKFLFDGKTSVEAATARQIKEIKKRGGVPSSRKKSSRFKPVSPSLSGSRGKVELSEKTVGQFIPDRLKAENWTPLGKRLGGN